MKKAKDIFRLLNEFRKNPKGLAKHLDNLKAQLDKMSNVLSEPGKIQVQMVEGEAVFDEAIEFLISLPFLKPLQWDDNLALSAMEHVLDIGPKGLLSYQSSDGTEPEERISRYGNYIDSLGENIDFGPNDAMGVLVSLTLDDGEPDRPHRENLFKTEYQKMGIACGPHKSEYQMCVMDFAFDFVAFGEEEEVASKSVSGNMNNPSVQSNYSNLIFQPNGNKNDINNDLKNDLKNNLKSEIKNDFKIPSASSYLNQSNNKNQQNNLNNITPNLIPSSSTYNPSSKPNNNLLNNANDLDAFVNSANTANFSNTNLTSNQINPLGTFGYSNTNSNPVAARPIERFPPESSTPNYYQSPLVQLSLDNEEIKFMKQSAIKESVINPNEHDQLIEQVKQINLQKKVLTKLVEVTTRIVYTFDDGSTKEVTEKQNHVFDLTHES